MSSGKPAARVGDIGAHLALQLLPGIGSLDVKHSGMPAWRTLVDIMQCKMPLPGTTTPHGPEICYLGSKSVLINNQMAVRMGDTVDGAGGANKIMSGDTSIYIGDAKFGLANSKDMEEYCKKFCGLMENWNSMSTREKERGLSDLINGVLSDNNIPDVNVTTRRTFREWLRGDKSLGYFSPWDWKIYINSKYLSGDMTSSTAARLANTVYHETRHCEQFFIVARQQAGLALQMTPTVTASQVSAAMYGMDLSVVQAAFANPIVDQSSPEGLLGQSVYRSVFGSRSKYRNEVLNTLRDAEGKDRMKAFDNYQALPEEKDAWEVGGETKNVEDCGGCKGINPAPPTEAPPHA